MLKFLAGLAVFPTALLLLWEALGSFKEIILHWQHTAWFVGGMALYALFHAIGWRFSRFYVLAHETTHALAGMLCGYSVKGMPKIGKDGGEVMLSGSNAFVALAPYCVPLYAILLPAAYHLALWKWPQTSAYRDYFTAGIGFFLSFHVLQTVDTLYQTKQSDVSMAGGSVFSYSVISAVNGIVLLGAFKLMYPDLINASGTSGRVWESTLSFWRSAWHYGCSAAAWAYLRVSGGQA